jgi:glycosyltransferase involved in cell wall biosynthesis
VSKIKIYHFNNGGGGGVLSVTRNLLKYASHPSIEHHIIYTVNRNIVEEYTINNIEGAASETVFYYLPSWNFYYTCRQLLKLLPGEKALIIANDWLELGMASNLGLQNKVIQIVHGDYDYYYELAKKHADAIDGYITVAASISDKLQVILPRRKKDIDCLYFPVPETNCKPAGKDADSVIFIGRCTEGKGYHLLPAIASELAAKNINLQWHIVGEPADMDQYPWPSSVNVVFHGLLPNAEVNKLLCSMQYFILPSEGEGMPVSLIESMKAGVIPVMNNLPGGVQELIKDGKTGYLSKNNTVDEYVHIIESLVNNIDKDSISKNCRTLANEMFNPLINTKHYETFFEKVATSKVAVKPAKKVYGSRLDQTWLPNLVTKSIRSLD